MLSESIKNLEFEVILNHISNSCNSDISKLRLKNSELVYNAEELRNKMSEISETKEIYQAEAGLPLWSFVDIREILHKIEPIGSYLEIPDCQAVQNLLEISLDLKRFFKKYSERFPNLQRVVETIFDLSTLNNLIKNTIDPSDNIFDNASKELRTIRSDIEYQHKQIHIILERIIRKKSEFLQEEYITLREGRLVLPVREFSINKVPGIVHGQSQTGQTQYIEPLEAVQLNNHLNEMYRAEKIEIIKILQRIADNIREQSQEITQNFNQIIYFDILQAKARYSITENAAAPEISNDFSWDIRNGFHPILLNKLKESTVPLDLQIGNDYRILVISGPNAGGKTVTLKTLGLLQLLFQSGFHVPVGEGSKFPICEGIFAVIGDEQSIENDLSTFSSHIKNINYIDKNVKTNSLVLIDEIGSGTDPAEGSALAIAILEKLNEKGIITIASTHQGALKEFAYKTEHVQNAAMQFDIDSLRPLFRLDVGLPGSSFAFEISERLGMDKSIIDAARARMGDSSNEIDNLIIDLAKEKQKFHILTQEVSIKNTELEGLKNLYQQRADELKKKKNKFEKEAKEEAGKVLQEVNKTIENLVADIKKSDAAPEIIKRSKSNIAELKKKIKSDTPGKVIDINDLKVGQIVESIKFSLAGEIQAINKDKKEIEIEAKGVKFKVPLKDLAVSKDQKISESKISGIKPIIRQVDNEVDLRGLLSDDALIELERYLDLAQHSGWKEIRIIHGKGTGALRKSIHMFLRKNSLVKDFNLAKYGQGDSGVTIIKL
jgi:DNA mismatch repair protein MutS2